MSPQNLFFLTTVRLFMWLIIPGSLCHPAADNVFWCPCTPPAQLGSLPDLTTSSMGLQLATALRPTADETAQARVEPASLSLSLSLIYQLWQGQH